MMVGGTVKWEPAVGGFVVVVVSATRNGPAVDAFFFMA